MKQKLLASALIGTLLLSGNTPAVDAATYSNGTSTGTFNVSMTVQANCTISANALSFISNNVLTTAVNQQTTLSVTCTNTTPYNVGLDAGNVTGSTVANRLMAGTSAGNTTTTVAFQIYQDLARTLPWGSTQGTNTVGGTGTGAAQAIPVYGQVPVQVTPKPDTYQTAITATVYF